MNGQVSNLNRITFNMLFNVYSQNGLTPVKASGNYIYNNDGRKYLDCYGGHGVISIGHNHPKWTEAIAQQFQGISFYSNAVTIPQQEILSQKLATISGYPDHALFLINSGAEANENALKVASFHTKREKVISFYGSFHGRTSGAMAVSDSQSMKSPFNSDHHVQFFNLGDLKVLNEIQNNDTAAVIIEGIQGIAGVVDPGKEFFIKLRDACSESGTVLILDEVQSGFGRTGEFFAHLNSGIKADIITMAKGMGNGFPVGGLLIHPEIEAKQGMLGSTFGGSYMATAAAIAVIDVLEDQNLLTNAHAVGKKLVHDLSEIKEIKEVRGRGLMLGIELYENSLSSRKKLLEDGIVTGSSSNQNVLRILPPLTFSYEEASLFTKSLKSILEISS